MIYKVFVSFGGKFLIRVIRAIRGKKINLNSHQKNGFQSIYLRS
jgi:hypothetical protein